MKTSIIICAYNEEETIFNVVAACCKHNPDAEVIVVDDASTDNTEAVLETLSIHHKFDYLKLPENKGKSYAMARGAESATNEILMFISAGIVNLRKEHFENLLNPVLTGRADLVFGSPCGFTIDYRLNPYKSVSGQKVLLKEDFMEILDDVREIRFGVESYIMMYYQTIGRRVHFAVLDGANEVSLSSAESRYGRSILENDPEVANALLANYDLITKRIQNNIQKSHNYTRSTITSVQFELNKRMKVLKDRILEIA